MAKLPFKTNKSVLTVNINQAYKNEIIGLTGWLPAYPNIAGVQGVEWLPLITTNGIADPQTIRYKQRFNGPMQPTPALLSSNRLLAVWTNLNIPYENAKLIKVLPGGTIPFFRCDWPPYWVNVDRVRVLLLIQIDANVLWTWQGQTPQVFNEGEIYVINHKWPHNVVNNGTQDCYYLIADIASTKYAGILSGNV